MKHIGRGLSALLAFSILTSGYACLTHAPPVAEAFERLGLPTNLMTLLGIYKLLGVAGLALVTLRPMPRLHEWVFAGFAFNFLGATWLHLAAGDTAQQAAPVVLLLVLVFAAWATSPASSR